MDRAEGWPERFHDSLSQFEVTRAIGAEHAI